MPISRHRPARRSFAAAASALLLLTAALGCSDAAEPTTPPEPATASTPAEPSALLGSDGLLGTGVGSSLLTCTPLPPAHAEARIGPAGGTLRVGPHTFVVPAGALSDTVTITADVASESVNSVRFGPEGLRFAQGHPARLTLSYANCSLLGQLMPKRVAYTDGQLGILELLPSVDELLASRVSANIAHFSRYAVAW
jgi:hypothetical protein